MQSTMQSLVHQQAKNAVILERHEERMNGLQENFRLLTQLAQNHDERMDASVDVDVLREKVVRLYRLSDPENPTLCRSGEVAEAEPALPGWAMSVDDIMN